MKIFRVITTLHRHLIHLKCVCLTICLTPQGYTAVKHQREVGTGYFDLVSLAAAGGQSSTTALKDSTEKAQFESTTTQSAPLKPKFDTPAATEMPVPVSSPSIKAPGMGATMSAGGATKVMHT